MLPPHNQDNHQQGDPQLYSNNQASSRAALGTTCSKVLVAILWICMQDRLRELLARGRFEGGPSNDITVHKKLIPVHGD